MNYHSYSYKYEKGQGHIKGQGHLMYLKQKNDGVLILFSLNLAIFYCYVAMATIFNKLKCCI